MLLRLLLILILSLSAVPHAQAWNSAGHMAINLLAWEALTKSERAQLTAVIEHHPRFSEHFEGRMPPNIWEGSEAEKKQWLFAFAATWPDIVRRPSPGVSAQDVAEFNQGEWHYINLPIYLTPADRDLLAAGVTANRTQTPPADPHSPQQNILQATLSSLALLKGAETPAAKKSIALCWLLHLIGDAHQPCHASSLYVAPRFPQGDRGGNQLVVRGSLKLHAFWDNAILDTGRYNDVRGKVQRLVAQDPALKSLPTNVDLTPKTWLLESYELAKEHVYDEAIRGAIIAAAGEAELPPLNPPPEYSVNARKIAEARAKLAGQRMAALLHELLGEIKFEPIPDAIKSERAAPNRIGAIFSRRVGLKMTRSGVQVIALRPEI